MNTHHSTHTRFKSKKKWGQNFLMCEASIQKLIDHIHPTLHDDIIEIGPGHGALTWPLLAHVRHLHVVEIDPSLFHYYASHDQITLHAQDILLFDWSKKNTWRIVGNLPYYLSAPLLIQWIQEKSRLMDAHIMLQKEVALRLIAPPSTPHRSRLSVIMQLHFDIEKLFDLEPFVFHPIPKVHSSFVRLKPKHEVIHHSKALHHLLKRGFSQRRKMLRTSLGHEPIDTKIIDLSRRPESLTLEEWLMLARSFKQEVLETGR